MSDQRSLRKNQVVMVHGPGSIVDIGGESFVVCGIEKWRRNCLEECSLPRLAQRLRARQLLQPSSGDGFRNVPNSVCLKRFPTWLFCQRCRKMKKWEINDEQALRSGNAPECHCRGVLLPMDFVAICSAGHLSDIDWHQWCHAQKDGTGTGQCRKKDQLSFETSSSSGAGLGHLKVKCSACNSSKTLDSLQRDVPSWVCRRDHPKVYSGGTQPWQRDDEGKACPESLQVVLRGDSNLYYPRVISALDIPDADRDEQSDTRDEIIARLKSDPTVQMVRGMYQKNNEGLSRAVSEMIPEIAKRQEVDVEIVKEVICGSEQIETVIQDDGDHDLDLRTEEYPVLVQPTDVGGGHFQGTRYDVDSSDFGSALSGCIESVSLLDRLREVRVFQGFYRVESGGTDRLVPASLKPSTDWLPACEVFGEGIFIHFNRKALSEWDSNLPTVEINRFRELEERIEKSGIGFLPVPTPQLVLLHSFSHILMRQLCFECGYASTSLRERLYVDGGRMSGVLIYTADGDSEGTLGGLVRQGEPDRLPAIILRALHQAAWCSADPLCLETENLGMVGLNRAACHACLLAPETSCELANAMLDRRLLFGDDTGVTGFFSAVLEEAGVL